MKIANKIILLVIFLIGGMLANAVVGLLQLSRIQTELKDVATFDFKLNQIVHIIYESQLEKSTLFERVSRVTEELAFENVTAARGKHLHDHLGIVSDGFKKLSDQGALAIIQGKKIINDAKSNELSTKRGDDLDQAAALFMAIEKAHIHYDEIFSGITTRIPGFLLSIEDLNQMRMGERKLTKKVKELLEYIDAFTQSSLMKAKEAEMLARNVLVNNLIIAIFLGGLVTFLIIRSIAKPLKQLEQAAHQIGEGNLEVALNIQTKDEIGQVATAFNTMAGHLARAKSELESKNKSLSENLTLIENQHQELVKINKELDAFVHTISHDIRSPLSGIAGYTSILVNEYRDKLDARGHKSLDGLHSAVARLSEMINDLLELTKATRVHNPYEEVNMDDVIDSVLSKLEYRIEESKVKIIVGDHLPRLTCDRIKIEVALFNLITNAIKFSSKDKKRQAVVEINYEKNADDYEFIIKDNGIGIAVEDQQSIYEMFTRLERAKGYEGTGAGLSIVKAIIEDQGGRIWVVSKLNEGAAFHFTIPKNLS